jgi:hypothetical protein
LDRRNDDTLAHGESKLLGHLRLDITILDAEERAHDATGAQDLFGNVLRELDRNGEAESLRTWCAYHGGVDADDAASRIEERSA